MLPNESIIHSAGRIAVQSMEGERNGVQSSFWIENSSSLRSHGQPRNSFGQRNCQKGHWRSFCSIIYLTLYNALSTVSSFHFPRVFLGEFLPRIMDSVESMHFLKRKKSIFMKYLSLMSKNEGRFIICHFTGRASRWVSLTSSPLVIFLSSWGLILLSARQELSFSNVVMVTCHSQTVSLSRSMIPCQAQTSMFLEGESKTVSLAGTVTMYIVVVVIVIVFVHEPRQIEWCAGNCPSAWLNGWWGRCCRFFMGLVVVWYGLCLVIVIEVMVHKCKCDSFRWRVASSSSLLIYTE